MRDIREGLLTINEAAEALGVSRKTIHRWIAAGSLPARRLGGRMIYVKEADLDGLWTPVEPSELSGDR